jgi:hypothetical protein
MQELAMTDDGMSQNHLTCTEAKLTNIESLRPKHSEVSSLLVIFDQAPQGNWTCLMEYFSSLSSAALIPISASVVLTFCQSRTRTHTRIFTHVHTHVHKHVHTHTRTCTHTLTRTERPHERPSRTSPLPNVRLISSVCACLRFL